MLSAIQISPSAAGLLITVILILVSVGIDRLIMWLAKPKDRQPK